MLLNELERFVDEDTGYNDISSSIVPDRRLKAEVIAREDGVVAGLAEASQVFEYFDVLSITDLIDGSPVRQGDILFILEGGARSVLRAERLALNFLGRMSGVATATRKYVELAGGIKIACTRKTTPGFRKFEKKAVIAGGGDPHRFNLSDAVMIKDNHITVMGLEKAVKAAKSIASFTQKIEVEVESVDDAVLAAGLGVDIIMFDNMTIDKIKESIVAITEKGLREGIILEASGSISLEDIAGYAGCGVDVISVGALTHSSRWLDISMKVI